jgi:hypothetical protein
MRKIIKAYKHINPDIGITDRVKLIDGSGLCIVTGNENCDILTSYPNITKSEEILKNLEFEVIETNIEDKLITSKYEDNYGYLVDIKIRYNNIEKATFYTCSKFVHKIINNKPIPLKNSYLKISRL